MLTVGDLSLFCGREDGMVARGVGKHGCGRVEFLVGFERGNYSAALVVVALKDFRGEIFADELAVEI